jgi:hypothetical protein
LWNRGGDQNQCHRRFIVLECLGRQIPDQFHCFVGAAYHVGAMNGINLTKLGSGTHSMENPECRDWLARGWTIKAIKADLRIPKKGPCVATDD